MPDTLSPSMVSAPGLAAFFVTNNRVIGRQVAGLSHTDSLLQPPVRGNCLNWVLGHIVVHRDYVLEAMGEEKVLGEDAVARYDRESQPITGDEPGVLPLETLLEALNTTQERISDALSRATDESLAQPAPKSEPATVARQVTFLLWHETYHVGQTEHLRQLAGTDDKVI
jgi:uncharacterized damage-inducible protein DinB